MLSEEEDRLPPPPFWRTQYFAFMVMRKPGRRKIDPIDVRLTLNRPVRKKRQANGRVRLWGWAGSIGAYIRVVTLADGETVHNVFEDSDFRP